MNKLIVAYSQLCAILVAAAIMLKAETERL